LNNPTPPVAFEVHGDIAQKYYSLNREAGFLGFPQSDETLLFDGMGRMNYFQGGEIYWRSSTGPSRSTGPSQDVIELSAVRRESSVIR
jgi:uncharacterized protein with LGFP repeats